MGIWCGSIAKGRENRDFLEKGEAENLQKFVQAAFQPQFLFDDGHEHVHADGGPDLSLHGVHGIAVESFDPQKGSEISHFPKT